VETARRIKDQGGLVSIPHPFDRFRSHVISRSALEELLPHTDIVEAFNSRNSLPADDRKAGAFAAEHGLLTSGVTDAHTAMELGRTYVEMPEFDGTPEGFMEALAKGTIVCRRMNPMIHLVTTFTKLKKRLTGARPPAR
jgi:predicted metal-dependent phosphoesterase TrpH